MSDYDELEETDRSEDEEEEDFGYLEDPERSLKPARRWIRTIIDERRRALAEEEAQDVKLTEEDVDEFLEKFPSITHQMYGKTPTILHAIFDMVQDDDQDMHIHSGTLEALVRRLALHATHLLCITNEENRNPLYLAITKKHRDLADYMVADFLPEDNNRQHLAGALEDCRGSERRKNCLHLAFEKALYPKTLVRMVKSASTTALEAVDNTGRRPMHYAVQYKNCNLEVISAFLAQDNEARSIQGSSTESQPLKTFLDVDENAKISIYREHVVSRKTHEEEQILKKEASHHKKKSDNLKDGGKDGRGFRDGIAGGRGAASHAKSEFGLQYGVGSMPSTRRGQAFPIALREAPSEIMDVEMIKRETERDRERKAEAESRQGSEAQSGHGGSSTDRQCLGQTGGRDGLVQTNPATAAKTTTALKRVPTMVDKNARSKPEAKPRRANTVKRSMTVKQTKSAKQAKSMGRTRRPKLDESALARVSKTALRMLKLHYMRTRSIEKATSWLYETNPEGMTKRFKSVFAPC